MNPPMSYEIFVHSDHFFKINSNILAKDEKIKEIHYIVSQMLGNWIIGKNVVQHGATF